MATLQNTFGPTTSGNTDTSTATGFNNAEVAEAVVRDGYAVVHDALEPDVLASLRHDLRPYLDAAHTGHESFMGKRTKRFGALIAKSTAVQDLIMHPTVLAVTDHALLPSCVSYQVQYTGVMHLDPGEKQQVLHRDTSLYPIANPCPPLTVATMWAITDFTRENGGTRIVPGSHRWNSDRAPTKSELVTAEMPAGSVLIYVGNVLHGGGSNRSDQARTGVALHYSLGWLRQEENQYLAVSPSQARALPDKLQELMGYSLGSSNLGFVDHIAPKDFLHGVRDPAKSDLSPPGLSERVDSLERMHVSHTAVGRARYYDINTD